MTDLSESEEEYLEALYKLDGRKNRVKIGELAENLGVKEPSVVEMLRKLEGKGFVDYESYSGVKLTEEGEGEGMRVTRRHRLAERLLTDVLNRDLPLVHEEACKLEHSIADETADEIARVLQNPETCPHGYPIPEEKTELKEGELISLAEGEEGREYRVVSIPEEEEDVQRLLPLAVLPGAKVELVDKPSFSAVMIKRGGDKLALSREIASQIEVRPYEGRKRRRRRGRASR